MTRLWLAPVVLRMSMLFAAAWLSSRLGRATSTADHVEPKQWTWFFLLLALAGSLPIAISARIAGHYFLPAIGLYALGFASASLPLIQPRLDGWRRRPAVARAVGSLGVALFVAAFVIPLLGRSLEPRDVAWVREYRALSAVMPRGVTLGTCDAVRSDWGLHAYMQRWFEVSLDPDRGTAAHRYYLQLTDRTCDSPTACESLGATTRMNLYECRTITN
jgi:hypothetical protein